MGLMVNEFIFYMYKYIHMYFSPFQRGVLSQSCILCRITIGFDISGILTNLLHFAPSLVLVKAFQFSKLKNKSFHKMVGGGGREIDFLGGN